MSPSRDGSRPAGCLNHSLGWWPGSAGPLLSTTFVRTLSLSIYQKTKHVYADWLQKITGTSPLVTNNPPGRFPTLDTVACFGAAGATAGAVLTCIACRSRVAPPGRRGPMGRFRAERGLGPFELTKVSAQTSVLMARRDSSGVDDSIRQSYEKKGTFRTAANIVRHRGVLGLYSGVRYHLGEYRRGWTEGGGPARIEETPSGPVGQRLIRHGNSTRRLGHRHLFHDLRDRQASGLLHDQSVRGTLGRGPCRRRLRHHELRMRE